MMDKPIQMNKYWCTRVRQFGLYPLWTLGNLQGFAPSKKLLLYVEIRNDNVAYNGETFICFRIRELYTD